MHERLVLAGTSRQSPDSRCGYQLFGEAEVVAPVRNASCEFGPVAQNGLVEISTVGSVAVVSATSSR